MSKYKKYYPVSSSFSSTFRICSQKNNDDDSRYLIMVDTMSNIIRIQVNNDKVKRGSIVPKTDYNLSFSISDFKQLLKEQFGITNDEAVFYCSFYDSEKTNNSDCGMRLFSLTELRNYCRLHSNVIRIPLNNIIVDFVFLLIEAEPNNIILKDITFSYRYSNKNFSIKNSAMKYKKEGGLYEFEKVYIPLSITAENIDYFDLVYYIQYNNSELFPNKDKRSKRIFFLTKDFNKVKYFIINSHVTIQDTLLNKLTSQIYSIENINYITVKEFGKYNFEYIIFDAEDEEEEKKLKTLFSQESIPEINTLILDLSTKEKFNEMIEFLVKDSYNTILIYKYNALEEKYRDFDITEYDYLSKALYKE